MGKGLTYHQELDKFERELLLKALRENNFNKTKTAEAINLDRKTIYNKLKKLGLEKYLLIKDFK